MSFYITRALLLLLSAAPLALSGSLGMPVPALAEAARGHAAPDAESFVQLQANRILGSLSGPHLSSDQKTQQFRAVIAQVADVPRVTEFVLGKYRRTTSPEQQARFAVAFRQFAYWVYERRLAAYEGRRLQVTGSAERRPGDVIVASQILGRSGDRPAIVQWRLIRGRDGSWRVVDVNVSGIWLAMVQQQDFVSTLDNSGGNLDALSADLRNRAGSPG